MSERKQRTPAEIIAETEAKLSRLRVKQAKQDAMSNPAVAPLVEELDALRKDIREAKKGLGDGPQSFNARVAKHDAWIVKIEAEREAATETLDLAESRKTEIESEIASVVNGIVETSDGMSAEA
jgi:capsule polysaccharide export protein KpsE/RkpR